MEFIAIHTLGRGISRLTTAENTFYPRRTTSNKVFSDKQDTPMGQFMSDAHKRLFGPSRETRILMLGINHAGKTAILNNIKEDKIYDFLPTIASNSETFECGNKHYSIFDIGGGDKIRHPLWMHYFEGIKGLIWVLDSSDREYLAEVKYELDNVLKYEESRDIPVLIYANKHDLPKAMSATELVEKLGLQAHEKHRWQVQYSCAVRGEGLWAGLKWLHNEITKRDVKL